MKDVRGIGGQVDEKGTVGNSTRFLEILLEEPGGLHVDTHGGKDDREIVLVTIVNTLGGSWSVDETGLSTNLSSNVVVW